MKHLKKILYSGGVIVSFLLAMPVLAQLPTGPPVTLDVVDLLIEDIAFFIIGVSMVIAVIVIIWAGIVYMSAGGAEQRVQSAKNILKNGIIGAAIVLGVGSILATISYVITRQSLY